MFSIPFSLSRSTTPITCSLVEETQVRWAMDVTPYFFARQAARSAVYWLVPPPAP